MRRTSSVQKTQKTQLVEVAPKSVLVGLTHVFKGKKVRSVVTDDGTWFVADDLASALDYSDRRAVQKILDEDELGSAVIQTAGGAQAVVVVNESGLYHLIFKSGKKDAQAFRKWVTAEVLPSLRRGNSSRNHEKVVGETNREDAALLTYLRRSGRYVVVRREAGELPLIHEEPDEAFLSRIARYDVQGMVHAIGLVDALWRTHVAYLEAGSLSGDHVVALNRTIGIAAGLGAGALAARPDGEGAIGAVSVPVKEMRR